MFTGLIEEVGKIRQVKKGANSAIITITAQKVLSDLQIGDSLAVNGICLTVTHLTATDATADMMHETLRRSSLMARPIGSLVNLERAMPANGRFGGHIVSGHIDGTGVIMSIRPDDNAVWFRIRPKPELLRYVVAKGSVTIDGISLTVASVTKEYFDVSIIPHTMAQTNLVAKRIGDVVNLETDCIGKYIEKMLEKRGSDYV
ncbi:MAG: riboflavin synthase [Lactococcus plantarum]|nr:riboflavin synthase [Lactococcus plantarum]MDN6069834.1 riboflavin synthase [Lactococcus plantarum]MDN6085001.1 riboflavin synthase [Lactococcus plantarum]